MKSALVSLVLSLAVNLDGVAANLALAFRPRMPIMQVLEAVPVNQSGAGVFQQYIDHSNQALGTFNQRFWYNASFWGGPGHPVILFTPGEAAADRYGVYITDRSLVGQFAKATKAAMVMLEHRYWGASTPFKVQDTKALQYHTLENAVADVNYFARTVKLPFDTNSRSNAPQAPWVFTGGSYPGALAAWIAKLAPGTIWAYHATSAPVQVSDNFWQYFEPVREGMPKNCSTNFQNIIQYVDSILYSGNKTEIAALKAKFGMEDLAHDDDFAGALSLPLGEWQSTTFTTGYSIFFKMCDAIQGVPINSTMGAKKTPAPNPQSYEKSVSTDVAVANFAAWMKDRYMVDFCLENYKYDEYRPKGSIGCLDSYNASSVMYTDQSSNNTFNRPWWWLLCNEPFYYWQTGAPEGQPTMVSRLVTPEYFQRQCPLFFPAQDGVSFDLQGGPGSPPRLPNKTTEMLNARTAGWLLNDTQRLVWVNGEFDPWRAASVSSKHRPGGPIATRPQAPAFLVKNGSHCQDISMLNGLANPELRKVQEAVVGQIRDWVEEFWTLKGRPETKGKAPNLPGLLRA